MVLNTNCWVSLKKIYSSELAFEMCVDLIHENLISRSTRLFQRYRKFVVSNLLNNFDAGKIMY
jgi:hypothetical protein